MAKETKSTPITLRVTPTAARIWDDLADKWGQSRAAVLERILREVAQAEGIDSSRVVAPQTEKEPVVA